MNLWAWIMSRTGSFRPAEVQEGSELAEDQKAVASGKDFRNHLHQSVGNVPELRDSYVFLEIRPFSSEHWLHLLFPREESMRTFFTDDGST